MVDTATEGFSRCKALLATAAGTASKALVGTQQYRATDISRLPMVATIDIGPASLGLFQLLADMAPSTVIDAELLDELVRKYFLGDLDQHRQVVPFWEMIFVSPGRGGPLKPMNALQGAA